MFATHAFAIVLSGLFVAAVVDSGSWYLVLAAILAAMSPHSLLYSSSESLASAGYHSVAQNYANLAFMAVSLAIAAVIPQAASQAYPVLGRVAAGLAGASVMASLLSAYIVFQTISTYIASAGHDDDEGVVSEDSTYM